MNIAKVKKKKTRTNKKKRKQQLTLEEKFQREWQRVQSLQESNAKLRQKITDFSQRVLQQIEQKERLFCSTVALQTQCLIHFIPKKTLPEYQREELIFWIQRNLEEMLNNPFNDHAEITRLMEQLYKHLEAHEKNQFDKWQKKYGDMEQDNGQDNLDGAANDEDEKIQSFEDLFAVFDDDDDNGDEVETDDDFADFFQSFFKEEFTQAEEFAEKQREHSNSLSKMLKSTSINKLFRRVAKILHPDLEQDQAAKEEKHKLMTELIEARDNKDVVKIITMYTEHVGQAPLELFNGDYEKMITLLKHQVERLEREKLDIIEENPNQAAVYYRFYDASEAKVKREIREYLKELDSRMHSLKELTEQLTSLKKIKPILRQMSDISIFSI